MRRRPRLTCHGDAVVPSGGFFGPVLSAFLEENSPRPFDALLVALRGPTRSAKGEITVKVIRTLSLCVNVEISEDFLYSDNFY